MTNQNYDNDFINTTPIETTIENRQFTLKTLTGEESDTITNQYTKFVQDPDNPENFKINFDLALRNKLLLQHCVTNTPYTINNTPYNQLPVSEKVKLLQNLKPNLRNKLLKKIREINQMDDEVKKN